jgi:hypothetical protein
VTGGGSPRGRAGWWAATLAVPAAVIAFHWRAAMPGNAFVGADLRSFFWAVREATAAALRAGHLPGWQRGIFLGYPLLADPQAAVLDPGTLLTLPWDAPRALTLAALLHLCIGGWGMVAWLRWRGLAAPEALLGALLFALGAKQTVHLQHWTFAASMAWWPWMLAGLDAFAAGGRGRSLALTAAAAALSWLGGAPQMAYFGTLVAGAHAAALAPALWRRRPADAVLALAAAPLGLLLAAPIVLPVMELARLGPRGAGVAYEYATSWKWPDRWGLALFLLPRAYGGGWGGEEMNLWEATGYLGILPLGLVAAAPLRRRGLWVFAALGALGVWLSFGEDAWLGLHHAFYRLLPGYGSFRNPTRGLMVTLLASALLAAEGLSALRDRRTGALARASIALAAVIAIAPLCAHAPSFSLDRAAAAHGAVAAVVLALAGLAWLAAGHHGGLARGRQAAEGARSFASLRLCARTSLAVRAVGAARPLEPGRASRWRAVWALAPLALCFADLRYHFGDANLVEPAAWHAPVLAEAAALVPKAPAPRRVALLSRFAGRASDVPLRLGWENATGYGPSVIQRVRSLLEATARGRFELPHPVDADTNIPHPDPTSPLWPLFGTPLVFAEAPVAGLAPAAELRPEWEKPSHVYRAPALPRVFWVGSWTVVPDDAVGPELAAAALGERALLAPGSPVERLPLPGPPGPPVLAEAIRAVGDVTAATVVAPRAGLAVALEPWFPGWTAEVDGVAAPVLRADHAFMAVPVPRGRHAVRFTYRPTRLALGAAVGALTLAAWLAVLAWRRAGPRRQYR